MKKRVAIIGSGLSLELFDKNGPKNQGDFEIVLYRRNMSFISLMSKAVEYDFNQLSKELNVDDAQLILDELDKDTLSALVVAQPDILMLDFCGDAFCGGVETQEGSFLTRNFKDMERAYAFSDTKISRILSANQSVQDYLDYSNIWCQAFNNFIDFVQRFLPVTLILVNTIDFSEETKRKNNISQVWIRFNEYAQKRHSSH